MDSISGVLSMLLEQNRMQASLGPSSSVLPLLPRFFL